jgi:hypothetical protein
MWHYCHLCGMSRLAILSIFNGFTQFFQANTTPVSLTMTTSSHVLPKSLAKITLLSNVIRAVEEDY